VAGLTNDGFLADRSLPAGNAAAMHLGIIIASQRA
jgi:hypothetical protein